MLFIFPLLLLRSLETHMHALVQIDRDIELTMDHPIDALQFEWHGRNFRQKALNTCLELSEVHWPINRREIHLLQ